jgi:hypothetical protein
MATCFGVFIYAIIRPADIKVNFKVTLCQIGCHVLLDAMLDFRKNVTVTYIKCFFSEFLYKFVESIFTLRRTEQDIIMNVYWSSLRYPLLSCFHISYPILSDFHVRYPLLSGFIKVPVIVSLYARYLLLSGVHVRYPLMSGLHVRCL